MPKNGRSVVSYATALASAAENECVGSAENETEAVIQQAPDCGANSVANH